MEVDKIIDSLTSLAEPGQQAQHVVVPFSSRLCVLRWPRKRQFVLKDMAAANNKRTDALGYERYIFQGGDWGSSIARIMAVDFPENCVAMDINMAIAAPPSCGDTL